VCTGHYARVALRDDGTRELHRAIDIAKDQSYVLAVIGAERLSVAMFPLGEAASKAEVRAEAQARGLGVSQKPDSYDICFIADGDTQGFLQRRLGGRPGDIVDQAGVVVGTHGGAYAFTVGQRKGLHLGRPAADGEPRYVTEVRVDANVVVVGPETLLSVAHIEGDQVVWLAVDVPAATPTPCTLQVRAHGEPAPGRVTLAGGRMLVDLDSPMRGIAAGQAMVAYAGTRVLGQATVGARSAP
jgi:tRNA-specific 2-thiouridylase